MNILVQTPIPQFIHWKIPFTGNLKRSGAWNESETETSLFAAVFPHRHREKRTGQNMENYYKIFPGISVKVAPSKDGIRSFVFTRSRNNTAARFYSLILYYVYFFQRSLRPWKIYTTGGIFENERRVAIKWILEKVLGEETFKKRRMEITYCEIAACGNVWGKWKKIRTEHATDKKLSNWTVDV